MLDGAQYVAIDVTDSSDRKNYEFLWDGREGLIPVVGVTRVAEKEGRDREAMLGGYFLIALSEAAAAERLLVFRRGERGAPIAGIWPAAKWGKLMEALMEADATALPNAGIAINLVRDAGCERFLSAYPSFEVKTSSDEWRRAACVRGATQPRR